MLLPHAISLSRPLTHVRTRVARCRADTTHSLPLLPRMHPVATLLSHKPSHRDEFTRAACEISRPSQLRCRCSLPPPIYLVLAQARQIAWPLLLCIPPKFSPPHRLGWRRARVASVTFSNSSWRLCPSIPHIGVSLRPCFPFLMVTLPSPSSWSPCPCLFPHREDGTPSSPAELAEARPRCRRLVSPILVSFDLGAHVRLVHRGSLLFLTPPFFFVVVAQIYRNAFITVASPEHTQTSPPHSISFLTWTLGEPLCPLAY